MRLRNGEPIRKIREDYRSASEFTKALGIFLEEQIVKTENLQCENVSIEGLLKNGKDNVEKLARQAEESQRTINQRQQEIKFLEEKKCQLTEKNEALGKTVRELSAAVESFEARGFTVELIDLLSRSVAENGDLVREVLLNKDKASRLIDEIAALNAEKNDLQLAINKDKIELKRARRTVNIEQRHLEELKVQEEKLKFRIGLFEQQTNALSQQIDERSSQFSGFVSRSHQAIDATANQTVKAIERTSALVGSELMRQANVAVEALAALRFERMQVEQEKKRIAPILSLLESESPEDLLNSVAPQTVLLLLQRAELWFKLKYPKATLFVNYNLMTNKFDSMPFASPTRASAYLEVAVEAVKLQIANQASKN